MAEGDKFGWSPDIGKFVRRGNTIYSEWGHVYVDGDGALFRTGPVTETPPAQPFENYADWTDEQRAHRLALNEREAEQRRKEEKAEHEARYKLVAQAKLKLSAEEFKAVLSTGVGFGRGYGEDSELYEQIVGGWPS